MVSSVADLSGSWKYFFLVVKASNDTAKLNGFVLPLLAINLISTFISALLLNRLVRNYLNLGKSDNIMMKAANEAADMLTKLEIYVQDFPQFILTTAINSLTGGEWTPTAIYNITTSGFNFVFNLLDLATPHEEIEENVEEETDLNVTNSNIEIS
eukprot:CAMPEP_0195523534 /NCGR_PEP_ID=MMETSP0794_2-20130614/22806_1 /TAXON_ID=515487 /ORGANISM="Stephanopyxis turris, Strain CCMP 815" /LENGTH=154 /DNA_ID=CAMNT_0040653551 /DNA_START=272 /DNA_END=736 /DNA_ORIENTATION=+